MIKESIRLGYIQETFISDNGKEFMHVDFKSMCRSMGLEHHVIGIEAHRSYVRVKRIIRMIRDGVVKWVMICH